MATLPQFTELAYVVTAATTSNRSVVAGGALDFEFASSARWANDLTIGRAVRLVIDLVGHDDPRLSLEFPHTSPAGSNPCNLPSRAALDAKVSRTMRL